MTYETKYMFIGGPLDGQRRKTWGDPYYQTIIPECVPIKFDFDKDITTTNVNYFTYRLKSIGSAKGRNFFYAPEEWSDHDAVAHLIEKYNVPTDKWRPIEYAPKDRSVLLWFSNGTVMIGRQRYGLYGEPQQDVYAWRCDSSGRFGGYPRFFCELPAPPLTKTA